MCALELTNSVHASHHQVTGHLTRFGPVFAPFKSGALRIEGQADSRLFEVTRAARLRLSRAFWRANIHCFSVVTTEPEVRNIKPKKYSSTLSFSTRFARIRHG